MLEFEELGLMVDPETVELPEEAALEQAFDYYDAVTKEDIINVDGVKRDPDRVKVILKAIARNNSTLAKDTTIMADISANFGDISKPTYYSYVDSLKRLFVIEDLRAGLQTLDQNHQ